MNYEIVLFLFGYLIAGGVAAKVIDFYGARLLFLLTEPKAALIVLWPGYLALLVVHRFELSYTKRGKEWRETLSRFGL